MKSNYMSLLTVLACALSLVSSQTYSQGGYIGPQLGIYSAKDADNAKLMGGVALRLQLIPILGVEGSINYRSEDYAGGRVSVRSWPIMITALVFPMPILYGAIGAGWYNTTFNYHAAIIGQNIDSETKLQKGWHFGGGLELPVGTNMKIAGDIRYVFLNYDFKQFSGSSEISANFYVITVGLFFAL